MPTYPHIDRTLDNRAIYATLKVMLKAFMNVVLVLGLFAILWGWLGVLKQVYGQAIQTPVMGKLSLESAIGFTSLSADNDLLTDEVDIMVNDYIEQRKLRLKWIIVDSSMLGS